MEPTHEPELTAAVDLCTVDGSRLNPAARGWSRIPLHRANLHGVWGRTKKWDYWAILGGDIAVGLVYADVDYLGLATVWWGNLATGESGGTDRAIPAARGVRLPDHPSTVPLRFHDDKLELEIFDDGPGPGSDPRARAARDVTTTIRARWAEKDGRRCELDTQILRPAGHESLNVVIPWSERRFQFTTKGQAMPATGHLRVGDDEHRFGGASGNDGPQSWGVVDIGRGRWPYSTRWNWGGGAGVARSGEVIGIQLGAKWTEGTGFTENGILVDGRLHKIGRELRWDYSWERPMDPWRVVDPGGAIDLTLHPRFDKHGATRALVLSTEVHQVFGTWTGTVADAEGRPYEVEGVQGFAEESRSRW